MSYRAISRCAAVASVLLLGSCNEPQFQLGFLDDTSPPSILIQKTAGDTMDVTGGVKFAVNALDNLGLKTVDIQLTGGLDTLISTVFTSAVTSFVLPVDIILPTNTTAGGVILLTATATDGNDNGATSVDSVFLKNDAALIVTILAPIDGAVTSEGKQLPVEIRAQQRDGVRRVGYTVAGAFIGGDSIGPLSPPNPDTTFFDTLTVPTGTTLPTFTITGFAEDSTRRRATSSSVTVTIETVATDVTPPIVTFSIGDRVEVDDSITVNATDPSGIIEMGWAATLLDGTPVRGDTATFAGNLTAISQTWELGFDFASLPQNVIITAHAIDLAGNVGSSAAIPAPAPGVSFQVAQGVDTVIVVHGITRPLPAGGRIADAIYNRNLNEVYLTNVELDRLEVFQVTDSTFDPDGIDVGSRPWGIALWPRDINGNNDDTVVVANSGGTNLSIVNVQTRLEDRRHLLPNFLIQSVQTEIDPATNQIKLKITEFDFSDRPEYLGMTCDPGGGTTCLADQVYAVYSTTPTEGQPGDPVNFILRGTVRWENLTSAAPSSHFWWEMAAVAPSPDSDTLQVIVDRGPGVAQENILSAACGRTVNMEELAFLDTTFVRNSGDFTHALVGEGGSSAIPPNVFARAIGYDRTVGHVQNACPLIIISGVPFSGIEQVDGGISPGIRVRDFIANTAIAVKSIALNFNGLTNLIRADSIYVLDEGLRLQGLVAIGGPNPGMDLNFDHAFNAQVAGTPTFGGTLSPNDRLVFSGGEQAQIDVFDTFFYGKVSTILIRDPVTGPLRVAELPSGQQILVGVTGSGVVIVQLPPVTNVFLAGDTWGAPVN